MMNCHAAITRALARHDGPRGCVAESVARVAVPTESQWPERLPKAYRYPCVSMAPAFDVQGCACRIGDNPIEGCRPMSRTERHDGAPLTALSFGHAGMPDGVARHGP